MVLSPFLLSFFCFINCPILSLYVFSVTIRLGRRPFRNETFIGDYNSHRCHSASVNIFKPDENTEQLISRVITGLTVYLWLTRTGFPENEQVCFRDNNTQHIAKDSLVPRFFLTACQLWICNGWRWKTSYKVFFSMHCLVGMSVWNLTHFAGYIFAMMILLRLRITLFSYFIIRHISLHFISCI